MMADATLQIDIIANDKASAVISGIRKDVGQLGSSASGVVKAGTSIKNFGENLDNATKPLQAVSLGLIAAGAASTKAAIDFEKGFAAVKKTVDGTPEQLEAVKKGIIDLTTVGIGGRSALPATTAELNEIAAAAGQLGIKTENIVEFTEVMAQMGSATNLAGEAGAATLARLMNVTDTDQGFIRNMGSSIVELGNNFATTEAEIAAMAMRMGSTATIVGMSVQDVLGFSTALSSLGIEAEAGGSAFSRILMSISQSVSKGGDDLKAFADVAGMSGAEFAKAWKSDATGAFTEFLEGLSKNEDIIAKLEDLGFANIRDITGLQNLSGAKGIELVTNALKMSNDAWSENVALQKEADAMAQTLAGQMTITKNNVVEAGRAFGEMIMPSVAGASEKIKELAQGLNEMDDAQKSGVVSAATSFATVGLAAKGISAVAKGVGELSPAWRAAALGITAVTAAVSYGIGKYEAYSYAQKHWADGAAEAAVNAREAAGQLDRLSSLQKEVKDLQVVISSSDSSKEEIETAKKRLDEIAQLLANEYNLTIEADNENLDETIEKLQTAIDKKTQLALSDLKRTQADLQFELADDTDDYKGHEAKRAELQSDYDKTQAEADALGEAATAAQTAWLEYSNGTKTAMEAIEEANKTLAGTGFKQIENVLELEEYGDLLKKKAKDVQGEADGIKSDMTAEDEAMEKYIASRTDFIAGAIALAEKGDISAGVKQMQTAVNAFGASADEVVLQWAAVKNGFDSIDSARAAGQLEAIVNMANELGHAYELIPKDMELEISADGTVKWKSGEVEQPSEEEKTTEGTINYKKGEVEQPSQDELNLNGTINYNIRIKGLGNVSPGESWYDWGVKKQAKGTQNFPGGLAMVNDETGIADNRELIIDRGRAFIPQGRNVILPLSRGARVYTASQTKALARALGIPGFASGKDNSDGFVAAREALSHRKATSAMTVTEELNEWIRLSKEYTSNQKDVWDIQEEIFSLTRKQTEELNKQSEAYISTRTALGDWAEYGDDPISAYNRIKERNLAELEAGRITWDEYSDTMYSAGEKMLDDRVKQSEEWISYQKKYCNMSAEEEMAAYQRIQAYTLQYYEQGLINQEVFLKEWSANNEKYLDADIERRAAESERWEKDMENWIKIRETYGDWDEYGDSLSQTYARSINRIDDLYARGIISWQEAEDKKLEYSLAMYEAASDEYDEVLAEQQERIDEMRDEFAKEEEALRDSWAVSDRKADLSEVNQLLRIYKNASTEAGQERYKELLKQKEQLERDEQLYQLEVKNNAVIEQLEAEYKRLEENKKQVLSRLKIDCGTMSDTGLDISATSRETYELAREISLDYTAAAESTLVSLGEVVNLLEGIKKVLGGRSTNTYNDNKTVNIAGGASSSEIFRYINGVVVGSIENI